ncbi:MAG: response regulator [Verrucomicrobia bacterium]|nr:response regulator [Verrucomicrobiota bacterium]
MSTLSVQQPKGEASSRPTIYVVDDEPLMLNLTEMALASGGWNLRSFTDPEKALAALAAADPKPKLLITDHIMTGLNGLELAEQCRRLFPPLKVIVVSGSADEDVIGQASTVLDGFVPKPYRAQELLSLVSSILAESDEPHSGR